MVYIPRPSGGGAGNSWTPNYGGSRPPQAAPYRGGSYGLERDFGMRDMFAQGDINAYMRNMDQQQNRNNYDYQYQLAQAGMATPEQIQEAIGSLGTSLGDYANLRDNGAYSAAQEGTILTDAYQQAAKTTAGMQHGANAQALQYGGRPNAGMTAALGMAGQFQGSANRGQALSQIEREEAQNRMAGIAGYANVSGQIANLNTIATKGGGITGGMPSGYNDDDFMNKYNNWREAEVGKSGQNSFGVSPTAPAYAPAYPAAGGGGGGRGGHTGYSGNYHSGGGYGGGYGGYGDGGNGMGGAPKMITWKSRKF